MRPEQRRAVRSALGPAALSDTALRIQVNVNEELHRRLLDGVYGPGLADFADADARAHATKALRSGGSDQVAIMIGTSRAADGPIRDAAIRRLAAGARGTGSEPAARMRARLRSIRRARCLPVVAAVAVVAVLGVTFLGGLVLGRNGAERPAVAAPPAGSAVPVPPGRIAGGFATIIGVNPAEQTVVAFLRQGESVLPQGPCLPAAVDTWFCPSRGDLPPDQSAELIAYAMRSDHARRVLGAPDLRPPEPDWGPAHEVK
jgi:hypothetical protein